MPTTKITKKTQRKPIQGKVRWITIHTISGRAVHIPIPDRGSRGGRKLQGAKVMAGQWAAKHNVAAKEGAKPEPPTKKKTEHKIKEAKESAAKKKSLTEKKIKEAKESAAKKKAEAAAAKKKEKESAAKKKAEAAAAKKKEREAAAKKKADEAAAKKKERETAAKKRSEEAAAKKKTKPTPKTTPKPEPKKEPPKKEAAKPAPKKEPAKVAEKKPISESEKHVQSYLEKQRAELSKGDPDFLRKYGEGIKSYERLVEKTPGLIPDGHTQERINVYLQAHGNAKIDRMEKELSKLEERHRSTMTDLYVQHGKLQAKMDEGDERYIDEHAQSAARINSERQLYLSRQRRLVVEVLKVPNPTTIHSSDVEGSEIHPNVRARHDSARNFLGGILHDNGESHNSVTLGQIPKDKEQRDHYIAGGEKGGVVMSSGPTDTSTSTHVHELGHWVDSNIKLNGSQVLYRSLKFLSSRVKGEQPKSINEVMNSKAYRDDERGWEDEFHKALGRKGVYAGKDYHGRATEIVSMGVQQLYDDPASMTKDRKYLGFIMGILDGRLR